MNDTMNETTADYAEQVEAARQTAIGVLTAAARSRHPEYGRLDFGDFLASVVTSVAANLGSVDRLIAGRPGSWEADLVRRLVGWDEEELVRHRTEPVVIHLNVHRLMEIRGPQNEDGVTPYELELYEVGDRYARLSDEDYDDTAAAAENAECEAITAKWAARFAAYAEQFTAAVRAEAARINGLAVPVQVKTDASADGGDDTTPDHPDDIDVDDPAFDPVALRLWDAALAAVPLPTGGRPGEDRR
jgi:hypothetical protein